MSIARKTSKKRHAILNLIRSTKEHPGAEWIYVRLKPEYPDLSLGTVYRNLGILREEGLIVSVGTVAGQERFDANTSPHSHFVCDLCGRMIDVDMDIPVIDGERLEELEKSADISIRSCGLSLGGLCGKCLENNQQQSLLT